MWVRWRGQYGAGNWTHWHETVGTRDNDPTRCGATPPTHRIESVERPPAIFRCGNCDRWGGHRRRNKLRVPK